MIPFLTYRRFVVVMLLLLLGTGCDSTEAQEEFVLDARQVPRGITRTDQNGRILEADDDDWRTGPLFGASILVDPAFPNPTGGESVSVQFSIREFNAFPGGLEIGSFDETARFRRLDALPEATDVGLYEFNFNPVVLGRAANVIRVFILDINGEIVSYGDIQIQP